MANFPALKTGAVAQYGSDRSRQFATQVLRFLDGSEQRFPGYGTALLAWVIRLDLLDESEAGSRRTWPVSLALAQKMAALDRFEKECERVEASASVEGFAQRMADKEHQALQRELGLASLGCEKEAAAMSGRPAAAAAENPDSADRERAKPRRL